MKGGERGPSLGIEQVIDPRERELEIKTRTDGLNLSSSRRNKGVSWVCVYVCQFRLPSVTVHADDLSKFLVFSRDMSRKCSSFPYDMDLKMI